MEDPQATEHRLTADDYHSHDRMCVLIAVSLGDSRIKRPKSLGIDHLVIESKVVSGVSARGMTIRRLCRNNLDMPRATAFGLEVSDVILHKRYVEQHFSSRCVCI